MPTATVTGFDVTSIDYALRPSSGQIALYVTGSSDIVASPAMRAANPKAVLIDQSPVITAIDTTADAYDMETGAITLSELGQVIKDAWNNYNHAVRPGQRKPTVYASASQITPVANALVAAGLGNSGTCLWIAHFGVSLADATAMVATESGPFPVVAFQYQNEANFDLDVFSVQWLNTVSSASPITIPPPTPWHGVFAGTRDGTVTKDGSTFVVPLVSHDNGKTFTPTAKGKGE
jgi:hypothetical protein